MRCSLAQWLEAKSNNSQILLVGQIYIDGSSRLVLESVLLAARELKSSIISRIQIGCRLFSVLASLPKVRGGGMGDEVLFGVVGSEDSRFLVIGGCPKCLFI